jgi:hypothetical protein
MIDFASQSQLRESPAMQGTHDIDETTTASDDDRLDPREAARLLAQTMRDARRDSTSGRRC